MTRLSRISSMLRSDPFCEGPCDKYNALKRVEREDIEYVPGCLTSPMIVTLIVRTLPRLTSTWVCPEEIAGYIPRSLLRILLYAASTVSPFK